MGLSEMIHSRVLHIIVWDVDETKIETIIQIDVNVVDFRNVLNIYLLLLN
jgi:hypothetical protein